MDKNKFLDYINERINFLDNEEKVIKDSFGKGNSNFAATAIAIKQTFKMLKEKVENNEFD